MEIEAVNIVLFDFDSHLEPRLDYRRCYRLGSDEPHHNRICGTRMYSDLIVVVSQFFGLVGQEVFLGASAA